MYTMLLKKIYNIQQKLMTVANKMTETMETDSYISTFIILVYVMTKCFKYNQLQKWLVFTTKSICTIIIYIYIIIPKRYNINGDIIGQKYYMLKPMTFFLATKITNYEKKLKYLTHVHTLAIFHNNYSLFCVSLF